jgi:hypothetical protein
MERIYLKNIRVENTLKITNDIYVKSDISIKHLSFLEIINENADEYESNIFMWVTILKLALPQVHLSVYHDEFDSIKKSTSVMINYYSSSNNEIQGIETEYELKKSDDDVINNTKKLVINESKKLKELRDNNKNNWKSTRWFFAFNLYLSACSCKDLSQSILSLVSALESLLMSETNELSFRVALYGSLIYSDDKEIRKKSYENIRRMYQIRSKLTHGSINSAVKEFKKDDILSAYFFFKKIVSSLLLKLNKISNNEIEKKIKNMLFESPNFK